MELRLNALGPDELLAATGGCGPSGDPLGV